MRICVVMPAYNSSATLPSVIEGVGAQGLSLIVVNDGSTDETGRVLSRFPAIDVVSFEWNRGKGEALKAGLARARRLGFTHAITMDSDGQHLTEDLAPMAEAARREPAAMVIGVRDLTGAGARRKSRFLRFNSDWWTWVTTGVWAGDSQSGFRVYPLRSFCRLKIVTSRYDFEVESLVKAVWSGVPIHKVPVRVRYGTGCESHFRPLADFLLVSLLNCRLVAARLFLPLPVRQVMIRRGFPRRRGRQRWPRLISQWLSSQSQRPGRFAAGVGVGACFGILPIWGFQMMAAWFVARRIGLSPVVTLAASNISFGAMAAVIIAISAWLGHWMLNGRSEPFTFMPHSAAQIGERLMEYLVGSVSLALGAGAVMGLLAYAAVRAVTWARRLIAGWGSHARS